MSLSPNPLYRNNRPNYYQEKTTDTVSVGSIINVFKTKSNKKSFDSQFIPTTNPINGTSSYVNISGNPQPENNPEYQYRGYLYCDGSEYDIKDYPLLYAAIGNAYGGTSSNGVTVLNGGSNYSTNTNVIFSTAQGIGGQPGITAEGTATVSGGIITAIIVTRAGIGYTSPPTITLTNTGGGAGATFSVRINSFGSISPITQENVFEFWPEENMGTFKVPDLLAKKIVGYGAVYGSGTPTIGNIEMTVGIDSIGGKWYLDEESQKGQFNLGQISTLGYTDVRDTLGGSIIGSQTVTITLQEKRLSGPPQHSHLLLNSECPQTQGLKPGGIYDSYLTGYKTGSGKIEGFTPAGGIALTHRHGLIKKPNTDGSFASYDLFNYTGGDTGLGSLRSNGNIYASGDSGTFELVTFTPNPTFRIFNNTSQIGGRIILTEGTPIYNYTEQQYTNPGTYTYSFNANVDEVTLSLFGGSGSGAVYDVAGNSGSTSSITLGSGQLSISAGGGNRGGAAGVSTGGAGGLAGSNAISGSLVSDFNVQSNISGSATGFAGGDGLPGPFWRVSNPVENPNGNWGGAKSAGGSAGLYILITDVVTLPAVTFTYPNTGNFNVNTTNANYSLNNVTIEIWGPRGADSNSPPGSFSCPTGFGGPGKYFKLSLKNLGPTSFSFYPGQQGLDRPGSATVGYGSGAGGVGGSGYSSNGGGGAAASVVVGLIGATTTILAGAGGGGGGGGFGEGQCGDNATGNPLTDGVQGVTEPLFSGAGGPGGNYGCTGGGGGGGGGGIGLSTQVVGPQGPGDAGGAGGGGPGGGGGGTGGHGGGYGGARGLSSYRSDIFNLVSSGNSDSTQGKISGQITEDRSYWTSGGGGGGTGGYVSGSISGSVLLANGINTATVVVGTGGGGVTKNGVSSSSGLNGSATIRTAVITGYQGGTTNTSIGDIIESASEGPLILSSGTGVGTSGGFKLPTTQVPTVVISPQGGGSGAGASASVTVSNGAVTGISIGSGGANYESPPKVRFLNGAGAGTTATTVLTNGSVTNITLGSGTGGAYNKYVRIGGAELERYIVLVPFDCTDVERIGVKAARGNGINGGDRPDDSADELRVYYNTDGSNNFPDNQFIGTLVPRPTDDEIASNYDGTSGDTKWYTYTINLPEGAQTAGVKFKILQKRTTASGANDNGGNNDHFGICEFFYDYKLISETVFVRTPGELASSASSVSYTIEGPGNSAYPAGIAVNDITFNMTGGVPLVPSPFLDPTRDIPLVEPYMLSKYLIKAY